LTKPVSPIALCFHGHFYQPPRENPWTDQVPREPSAAPFHDWNARIHSECYRANAFARINDGDGRIETIVDNYDRISFNFGPTLARWLGRHDPAVEGRLREADAAQRKRLGRGGAVAQAYAHPIVPLSSPRDARTQLVWGLHDFRRRFGHAAEGLWLPETAVSPATLETLIELGVRYTILAPEQIAAVRPVDTEEWSAVDRDSLDTGRGYLWRHRDGSGRTIALGIFDGPLSRAVAFGETANRAESLLDSVQASADRSKASEPRLVLCASDGELWGHHKKFADLTLAFATRVEAPRRGIDVTNLGAYLARHPPTWEVELAEGPDLEGTAWSCAHGLGRWKRDCGCNMGGGPGWNQAWRGPLRRALDIVRDAAAAFYEDAAGRFFPDPWRARDAYGDAVDDSPAARDRVLAPLAGPRWKSGGETTRLAARRLLELQRATLLMYASCGWFFDDVAGLEASLVIRMSAHALDLIAEAGGKPPTRQVLDALAEAKSNRPEAGTGADVFRRALGDRVTVAHAVAGAALCEAVSAERVNVGWEVALSPRRNGDGARATGGSARAVHLRTGAVETIAYTAQARAKGALVATAGKTRLAIDDLDAETKATLVMAELPSLLRGAVDEKVVALAVDAARELPPDGETPEGVARRATLTRVLFAALEGTPSAANLAHAADLVDIVALPDTAPDKRMLEERVWALCARGRPSAALRALAAKVGVAVAAAVTKPTVETPPA
jgi:alpha-amylase/alpha-mannosidase (GH57 family)